MPFKPTADLKKKKKLMWKKKRKKTGALQIISVDEKSILLTDWAVISVKKHCTSWQFVSYHISLPQLADLLYWRTQRKQWNAKESCEVTLTLGGDKPLVLPKLFFVENLTFAIL